MRVFFLPFSIFLFTDLPGAPENVDIECCSTTCTYTWVEPPLGDFKKEELNYRFEWSHSRFEIRFINVNQTKGRVMSNLVPNTNYTLAASTMLFINIKGTDIGKTTLHSFRTATVGK